MKRAADVNFWMRWLSQSADVNEARAVHADVERERELAVRRARAAERADERARRRVAEHAVDVGVDHEQVAAGVDRRAAGQARSPLRQVGSGSRLHAAINVSPT
jgi:hypothetical protein